MKLKRPSSLAVDARILPNGLRISINKNSYPIVYPADIWRGIPAAFKELLKDNLAYSTTMFLPQVLNLPGIGYRTARPLSETYLFKNGIYDMTSSAQEDGRSSREYVRRFFNTRYTFADEIIKTPGKIDLSKKLNRKAVIPFSFGKESLLSFALAREVGLEPILVSVVEPTHTHEYTHRKKLIREFEKEFKVKVHVVTNNPGEVTKSGRAWGIRTELGYGLQATEYAMMALPFAQYFNASYVILGNEQSCHDFALDAEGLMNYRSGYDQFREWTAQQGMLFSMMMGRRIQVMSLVEPLFEIAETKVLHHRYPQIAKYQMSCFAISSGARDTRWCQDCYKCSFMYPLFKAMDVDVEKLGFTQNMLDRKHRKHYESLFEGRKSGYYYGREDEMILAIYLAMRKGATGETVDRFRAKLMPYVKKHKRRIIKEYLGVHDTYNIPSEFKTKLMKMFTSELTDAG